MSIFDRVDATEKLRSGALGVAAANYDFVSGIDDSVLWTKILAAEREVQRRLTIRLEPTEVFPDPPTQQEVTDLAGKPYIVEPGYDLPPNFFGVQQWGMIRLRQRPVISITSIKLVYPALPSFSFTVPLEWIRIDHDYGQINIFPTALLASTPLSVFAIPAFGAGNQIPLMIRIRYTAGLNIADHPDIEDLIFRISVLRILQDSFLGQSGTISADGLSQSASTDISKMHDSIDSAIDTLREQLIGPIWGVL